MALDSNVRSGKWSCRRSNLEEYSRESGPKKTNKNKKVVNKWLGEGGVGLGRVGWGKGWGAGGRGGPRGPEGALGRGLG